MFRARRGRKCRQGGRFAETRSAFSRKSEARSTKPERSSKAGKKEMLKRGIRGTVAARVSVISSLDFWICFGFRASDFVLFAQRAVLPAQSAFPALRRFP